MGRKKTAPDAELDWWRKVRKLVVIAMFSDDVLMDRLVLKGGNAIDLIHGVSSRASVDVDLSLDGDFDDETRPGPEERITRALASTFQLEGLQVFDVRFHRRPKEISEDVKDFWGGYGVEFKLIEADRYERLGQDKDILRRNALKLGVGQTFSIDISKHEFTQPKALFDLDGYSIYVYTPEMIVCEKLRAICQQMPEYGPVVNRKRAGSSRARDFIDIYSLIEDRSLDMGTRVNRMLLARIFATKRVDTGLLKLIGKYREFHRASFQTVEATVNPGVLLKPFDFYFDYVLGLVERLKPLGNE